MWIPDSEVVKHGFRRQSLPGSFSRARSHSKDRMLDDGTSREPYKDLVYIGKKIPSKTFMAMQRKIAVEPKNTLKGIQYRLIATILQQYT